jgi:hypothetical protein
MVKSVNETVMVTTIIHLKVEAMKYTDLHKLKPGDKIVVPKSSMHIVQHHAIYLGQNHWGIDLIAENVFGLSVRIIPADQFFNENPLITRIERFNGENFQRRIAIERALEKLGQPYNLINYNCEHFANYVQTGVAKSSQVGWALVILTIAAIASFSD